MVRLENLPSINQHREEEEDNEVGRPPGPSYGAGRGHGPAGEQ